MAFALTIFVQAANQRIPLPISPGEVDEVCHHLFSILCADVDTPPTAGPPQPDFQTTLFVAFRTLCGHYDGDPLQAAVCARVLAFYFLMERSAGAVLADWVQPHPETPQFVGLHPAVVETIATVRLRGSVLLSAHAFLKLVVENAADPEGRQIH